MTAGEWERIKTLFDAALNLQAEQRSAYLEEACLGAPEVKKTVEELLRNLDEAGNFLEDHSWPHHPPAFVPQQLVAGRFRVIRQIATGGMGEVYEVFDDRLGLRLALKTIRTDLATRPDIYDRFKREVWIAREVPHEGICRIFELIEHTDSQATPACVIPCITMKLLDGHDLQTELRRRRPVPLGEAFSIAKQICEALQSLHDHGIIHRDLKPSNIMLVPGNDGGSRVVLTDFGLARRIDQSSRTLSGGLQQPGAPYFQAPEVLKGGRETVASDIYALGLVLDEMVTTSSAYTAESIHAMYWQKLWEKPIPPSKRALGLPPEWELAILKCLSSEPADRYATPMDLLKDLTAGSQPQKVPRWSDPLIPHIRFRGMIQRRSILVGAATATVAACAAIPTFIWSTGTISILVYPVVNETGDTELASAAKGISGEVVRRLTRIKNLHVFAIHDLSEDGRQPDVGASYKLESRLSRQGNRFELAIQLWDVDHRRIEYAQQFELSPGNSLALETKIAEGVVRTLEARLHTGLRVFAQSPVLALPQAATRNSTAYQSYIRGQVLLEDRTVKSALQAMAFFKQAVDADPNCALAWAAMADAQRIFMEFDHGPRGELLPNATAFAEKAVSIDPDSPEAQATLGAVLQIAWEWERAETAYKRAIALSPRFARGHRWYAGMLLQFGHFAEGLQRVRFALELDPTDYPSQAAYGFCLFYAGRPVEAMKHLESLLEEKDLISAHINLGMVYANLAGETGDAEARQFESKALREAEILRERETRGRDHSADYPLKWSPWLYAITYAYRRKPDLAQPWLDQLETGRRSGQISPVTVASVHAVLKERDRALDLLEMAAAYHERELTNLKISPFFRDLHDHPRFRSLLQTMRLPV